jgi:MATE family multidrug resistance protein
MIISLTTFLILSWYLGQAFGNHGLWCALSIFMVLRAVTLAFYYPRIEANLSISGASVPGNSGT